MRRFYIPSKTHLMLRSLHSGRLEARTKSMQRQAEHRPKPSPLRTAGDINHLARDEGGLLAAQKGDQVGDVARHAGAPHRDLAGALLLPLLGVAAEADRDGPRHLGVDKAG